MSPAQCRLPFYPTQGFGQELRDDSHGASRSADTSAWMSALSSLNGLGPKSEAMLLAVGIQTREDLERVGPLQAYILVRDQSEFKPSLNLLYAMIGALENKHWADIAKEERLSLLLALDGYEEFQELVGDG